MHLWPMSHEFMNSAVVNKKYICFLRGSYSWANFSLVDLINVVPKKACFHMFVSNNVQTIGTIICVETLPGRRSQTTRRDD